MDFYYAGWKQMERLKTFWYRLVALPLLKRIIVLEDHYETILSAYTSQTKELQTIRIDLLTASQEINDWKERAMTTNGDGAIAAQVIRERMRAESQCVLSARERAVSQRIRELEMENKLLRLKLKDRD